MALCEFHYFSTALGRMTAANILLPEVGKGPFPVLYLLHGLSDDYTMWLRRSSVEWHLRDVPLIVVMPDGGRGFYSDALEGDKFLTAIATELVDRVDRTFPTIPDKEHRCAAGLSMGGYGALKFALTFPDRFGAGVSMSGAVAWGHNKTNRDGTPHGPEWRRIFGPDPTDGPNDLWALVSNLPKESLPALRIDCGVEDFLIEDNRKFHAYLDEIGVTHDYDEYPGGHTWDYWDKHVVDAVAFCRKSLGF